MAVKTATRTSQYPLVAEFKFSFSDTMAAVTTGTSTDFGEGDAAGIFDIINMPVNSVVIGGEVITETAFDTAGYDVKIGHSDDDDEYLASTDLKGAGRQAITPTGYRNVSGLPLRFTFASDDVCTAGVMTVRIEYIIENRANEVQTY